MEALLDQEIRIAIREALETFHDVVGDEADAIRWWQMCVRAAIIFFYSILLYRLMPRKAFGSNAALDIVVVVILGSTLSRALTGNAPLLPALAATALLAALYAIVSMLARRARPVSRLVKGRPLLLMRDGEIDRRAMAEAQLGEHDLFENLRLQGVARLDEVAAAYLERNGRISVIKR